MTNSNSAGPTVAASNDDVTTGSAQRRQWTVALVEKSARSRGITPLLRLLAIFDVLNDLINRADREARSFVSQLARVSSTAARSADDAAFLLEFRTLISTLAGEAHLRNTDELTSSWWILMQGTIQRAMEGDLAAGRRGREMAADLTARFKTFAVEPVASDDELALAFDFDDYFEDDQPPLLPATSAPRAIGF